MNYFILHYTKNSKIQSIDSEKNGSYDNIMPQVLTFFFLGGGGGGGGG